MSIWKFNRTMKIIYNISKILSHLLHYQSIIGNNILKEIDFYFFYTRNITLPKFKVAIEKILVKFGKVIFKWVSTSLKGINCQNYK